ncbi:hypothetical protein CYMTET_14613 [Cymbomonas tetramitiformis]|uniref:Uncharacterized protein n=1 Tax=Cymbomonas tetramitiformis TaxID=36881 RepID=A0AAE0GG19_9CHLO|nr:hypothetical protein CYMTET_14613 [Cymbomonas tetramitiformis]
MLVLEHDIEREARVYKETLKEGRVKKTGLVDPLLALDYENAYKDENQNFVFVAPADFLADFVILDFFRGPSGRRVLRHVGPPKLGTFSITATSASPVVPGISYERDERLLFL